MNTSAPGGTPPPDSWKPLDARQRRVLGVLIEKAKTTPAGYPMSVNAIVSGCNQKNNRDPVTQYDDTDVENTLAELRQLGVVTEVDWLGRVPKYKHRAYEWLGVDKAELAVLTELMLRGAQTMGDLRARAARMETIEDLSTLKPIVDRLLTRGLMIELTPPGRGQLVTHAFYPPAELETIRRMPAASAAPVRGDRASAAAFAPGAAPAGDEVAALRRDLEALRARVAALEARAGLRPDDPPT